MPSIKKFEGLLNFTLPLQKTVEERVEDARKVEREIVFDNTIPLSMSKMSPKKKK